MRSTSRYGDTLPQVFRNAQRVLEAAERGMKFHPAGIGSAIGVFLQDFPPTDGQRLAIRISVDQIDASEKTVSEPPAPPPPPPTPKAKKPPKRSSDYGVSRGHLEGLDNVGLAIASQMLLALRSAHPRTVE